MRSIAAAFILFLMSATPARAGDAVQPEAGAPQQGAIARGLDVPVHVDSELKAGAIGEKRPAALVSLYGGLAALQAYDIYSTSTALARGGREGNPLMTGIVGHPAAFIAVDAATTGLTIFAAERLWRRHHRAKAVALMAVSNGVMAVVAAHNVSVLRTLR